MSTNDTVPLPSLLPDPEPTRGGAREHPEEDPVTVELDEIITSTLASQIVLGTMTAPEALKILWDYASAQVEPAE